MIRHLASNKHRESSGDESQGISPLLFCPVGGCKYAEKGFSRADHRRRHIRLRHKNAVGLLLGPPVDDSHAATGTSSGDAGKKEEIGDSTAHHG
jgi:hypothetical protein